MGFKRLAVYIDDDRSVESRIAFAAAIADRHGANLTGVFAVTPDPTTSYAAWPGLPDSGFMDQLVQAHRDRAAQKIADLKPKFEAATAGMKQRADWREVQGFPQDVMIWAARHVDLVVLPQPDSDDAEAQFNKEAVSDVVMRCGRPVLFHPYIDADPDIGTVLVAWDGGREAVRAFHDSVPFLAGSKVLFLSVLAKQQIDAASVNDEDLIAFAESHGASAKVDRHVGDNIRVGDIMMSRAADLGANLVVMGGYSHSRFREMVLGGTTRDILTQMPVPVLMSH